MSGLNILEELQDRSTEDWLVCDPKIPLASQQLWQLTARLSGALMQLPQKPKILLIESHPLRFLSGFLACVAANCPVFLGNPAWQQGEWQQVFEGVKPNLVLGKCPPGLSQDYPILELEIDSDWISLTQGDRTFIDDPQLPDFAIMIPTGGSSGQIRFVVHTWETLSHSVQGLSDYFGQLPIHSYCVLPLYHVSGLMQFMRSFLTRGKIIVESFKQLNTHFNPQVFFISLVPTQLQRLLTHHSEWLAQFRAVFLGGAPAWEALLIAAREAKIPLALTYGMTETASQVVSLKPRDFLQGNGSCGQVLPHAKIMIANEVGKALTANQMGIVCLESQSLMRGYYQDNVPLKSPLVTFQSDDLGYLDEQGYLYIIGRNSQKIITGGENVFPAEVEAAILATQQVQDVCILGVPDSDWGQVVTAVYVPGSVEVKPATLKSAIASLLAAYKHPKLWVAVNSLPRNAQGKINREQLLAIALLHQRR
ncbi:MAG: 2-succinylbenzoate--CoA ligase [Desertifilum sp. SIO1I2]|nr:2-succinylbenzoate--CoA ligase [Desertifilum sp. SIO1I2]